MLMTLNRLSAALLLACFAAAALAPSGHAQQPASTTPRQKVVIDTDIGDDIDDVLAVGLALSSPEFEVLGISSAWGNTQLRTRLLDRLLEQTGRTEIPVATGIEKHNPGAGEFSQARWAEREPAKEHAGAVDFLLEQIRRYPGEVTLVAIAPLTNVAAAYQKDPATFRKLKRIVMMGGSIHAGYEDLGYAPTRGPDPEYNIKMDIPAAQQVFGSGVPLFVMPLDSTQIKLDEYRRRLLFTQSTPLTDAVALLYEQWTATTHTVTPTMYDAVAVAYAIDPQLCPVQPVRIRVDSGGYTRVEDGPANAQVCLRSDSDAFFNFYLPRLLTQKLGEANSGGAKKP